MAAEGRSGLSGSTPAFCILPLFLLLFCAWSYNFSPHKGILVDLAYGEQTMLYKFGYGHSTLYSIWSSFWCKSSRSNANKITSQQGRGHASKVLLVLVLLAGDIHLNPGPTTCEQQASSVEQVRLSAGGDVETPPLHTPEPRGGELWSAQLFAQTQELLEQRHAEERNATEPSRQCTMCRQCTMSHPL